VLKVAVNGEIDDSGLVPSVVAPSKNVTVPVGVPVAGGLTVTVAVKVTDWPNTDGFVDEASVVVVPAPPTV
jgi:hypothetical protein